MGWIKAAGKVGYVRKISGVSHRGKKGFHREGKSAKGWGFPGGQQIARPQKKALKETREKHAAEGMGQKKRNNDVRGF